MRGWCADSSGVAELPMQLLIGACIIAFAAPIFYSAYGDLSENITSSRIEGEIERIMEVMEQVLSGDEGSTMMIEIPLKGMGSVDLRELSIGGELNSSKRFLISYSLSSGYGKKFSLDPPVPITGPEDGGLKLVNGDYDIRVENSKNHKGTYLFVTLE